MSNFSAGDIAIIGMACHFPQASNPEEFWALLQAGKEARTDLSDDELRSAGVPEELIRNPNYVKSGMFLAGMEQFDPGFFGFSPLDGRILDPQHRHFLECAWEALEDGGYDPFRTQAAIGVFAGSGHNAYLPYNLLSNPQLVSEVGFFLLRHTGNDKDFLATRVSYCFDLKGPSVNVQTACSTSLVAIHQAAQSLINGECDMALAGGVTIELPHRQGYLYKDSEILSGDGHCRPFDQSAGGTVFGSGVGVVLLKRLQDAIDANDNVQAIIRASAVNNDGAGKISYLAPSVDGQAAVIAEAINIAGIDPATVSYIATHGTGTQLGDPIEVAALTQAYGEGNNKRQYCGIGSVKSNIGHTDTAAGVASLISVVLSLKHRKLVPTLHYRAANAAIDFSRTPFFVCDQLQEWKSTAPLRAGISSLGVGGTNAHLILEEAPALPAGNPSKRQHLLLISGRNEQVLLRNLDRLNRFFDAAETDTNQLADAAYTLAVGRRAFRRRAFVVVNDKNDALAALDLSQRDRIVAADAPSSARQVAFMFAGGGAQYPTMGQGLYETEEVYRNTIDECLNHLKDFVDFDLKPLLFPADEQSRKAAEAILERPSRTIPALFVTQYAQACLWRSWGVEPAALIGHSMGENTAACLAGVFSLRDAIGLVALRGRLFETVGEGSMLSVDLDETALLPLLGPELSIAAINAPGLAVASGPKLALQDLEKRLIAQGIGHRRIRIDVAAHSSMLDPILMPFGNYLRSIQLQAPKIPFISNRTGTWITATEATSPDYWVAHLRNTVRFSDGIGKLLDAGNYVLLEVGPGRTLLSLASSHGSKQANQSILASMRHPDDQTADATHMLNTLGRVWQAGFEVNWEDFYAKQQRRRISLPTYAFEHMRCWVEPGNASLSTTSLGADAVERGATPETWLYDAIWQRVALPAAERLDEKRVLILHGEHALATALPTVLQGRGANVRTVHLTNRFDLKSSAWQVRGEVGDDFVHLADALQKANWVPTHVVNLLPLELNTSAAKDSYQRSRLLAFDAIFHLTQAAANEDWQHMRWLNLTMGALQLAGENMGSAYAALVFGPTRVLPREFPSWETRVMDITPSAALPILAENVANELAELQVWSDESRLIAWRGNARFCQSFCQSIQATVSATWHAKENGVYLITGGTGGLGLVAADALATQAKTTLVLVNRSALPEATYWPTLIAQNAPEAAVLRVIMALGDKGAKVVLETADVSDRASITSLAQRISALGTLSGIIHIAGVVEDAPMLNKDLEQCERVFAAKVQGTLLLDEIFDAAKLDFFVLYSSTSSFHGLPGQVDYAAANAFLDAFAQRRSAEGAPVIAINWPAWRSVGMAAAMNPASKPRLPAGRPLSQPLLQRLVHQDPHRSAFATLFSVDDYWVLNEHRIKDGPALIPGSGFMELARAAYAEHSQQTDKAAIEIAEASFEMPFVVADGEHRVMHIDLRNDGFSLTSDAFGERIEHARGLVRSASPINTRIELDVIRARCNVSQQRFNDPDHHPFLAFGERWQCLRRVLIGEQEALIELRVDDRFKDELHSYPLHPALYDMATAGAQVIIDGYRPRDELYVPIGCKRLHFNGAFTPRCFSHVRFRPGEGAHAHDIARFDVTVCDESGAVLLQVDEFTLRRVTDPNALKSLGQRVERGEHPVLKRTLELGIEPDQGRQVLMLLLGTSGKAQTIVSPYRLGFVAAELLRLALPERVAERPSHNPDIDPEIPAVEAGLQACPAIEDVVVRSFKDASDERRLVAYFLPDHAEFNTVGEIRRFARAHLLATAMPEQFVELDEWPRDAAGQVDRTALLDPLAPVDSYVAPRTTTEKLLARIWQEVLGVDRVGLADNFFDLGGHSLLSTRVIVQIFKRTGVRLDQPTMVLNTLEQVARELDQRAASKPNAGSANNSETTAPPPERKGKGLLRSLFGR